MSKDPTAAQKRRMAKVAALPCFGCNGPANVHHCRHECGMGQRNHDHVAPLCKWCHQDGPISRHGTGSKEFKETVGSDKELHERTCRRLGEI